MLSLVGVTVSASRAVRAGARTGAVTVTRQVSVKPPSVVVTVMVAVPAATAVTRPVVLTVATASLLET